ncbi:hypothetical protein BD310DRAFT_6518 [Dichomitus squalens]|uniref:Uncharacterized protein n=1 Tax=Dichomitus squalens TaxID=114155 RepID=A0A4Q9QCB5_9APHY|nr:hypothetical protein BD310DRAFT_6518 [Dichomitus squalens]
MLLLTALRKLCGSRPSCSAFAIFNPIRDAMTPTSSVSRTRFDRNTNKIVEHRYLVPLISQFQSGGLCSRPDASVLAQYLQHECDRRTVSASMVADLQMYEQTRLVARARLFSGIGLLLNSCISAIAHPTVANFGIAVLTFFHALRPSPQRNRARLEAPRVPAFPCPYLARQLIPYDTELLVRSQDSNSELAASWASQSQVDDVYSH